MLVYNKILKSKKKTKKTKKP